MGKTTFDEDGVLHVRRSHALVNRWNKAMAVGLRHNHDISFIVTKCKSLAAIFYLTNYVTKIEDPIWKRAAAAKELIPSLGNEEIQSPACEPGPTQRDCRQNKTRQFLMKVANRVLLKERCRR